jgi:hypothetical protein
LYAKARQHRTGGIAAGHHHDEVGASGSRRQAFGLLRQLIRSVLRVQDGSFFKSFHIKHAETPPGLDRDPADFEGASARRMKTQVRNASIGK